MKSTNGTHKRNENEIACQQTHAAHTHHSHFVRIGGRSAPLSSLDMFAPCHDIVKYQKSQCLRRIVQLWHWNGALPPPRCSFNGLIKILNDHFGTHIHKHTHTRHPGEI